MGNPLIIRQLKTMAAMYNIDINEITVSPVMFDDLYREATLVTYNPKTGPYELRYNNITIKRRKCDTCCQHGL